MNVIIIILHTVIALGTTTSISPDQSSYPNLVMVSPPTVLVKGLSSKVELTAAYQQFDLVIIKSVKSIVLLWY